MKKFIVGLGIVVGLCLSGSARADDEETRMLFGFSPGIGYARYWQPGFNRGVEWNMRLSVGMLNRKHMSSLTNSFLLGYTARHATTEPQIITIIIEPAYWKFVSLGGRFSQGFTTFGPLLHIRHLPLVDDDPNLSAGVTLGLGIDWVFRTTRIRWEVIRVRQLLFDGSFLGTSFGFVWEGERVS